MSKTSISEPSKEVQTIPGEWWLPATAPPPPLPSAYQSLWTANILVWEPLSELFYSILETSVPDPWHFDLDPDPDPALFVSDLQDAKKNSSFYCLLLFKGSSNIYCI